MNPQNVGRATAVTQQSFRTEGPAKTALPTGAAVLPGGSASIEVLAAILSMDSSKMQQRLARECQKTANEAQLTELENQVQSLREKANDVRDEGLLSGSLSIAGGALTMAGAASSADSADARIAGDEANGANAPTAALDRGEARYLNAQSAREARMTAAGGLLTGVAGPAAKATFVAAGDRADANASEAAKQAKVHESAKDEYASMVRDAQQSIEKAMQAIQAFAAEHAATTRAILQHGA